MDSLLLAAATDTPPDMDWPTAIFLIGAIATMTIGLVVAVWQGLATWRARMAVARDRAYQDLAADLASFQARITQDIERTLLELSEIRQQTAEIERLLKELD